MREGGTAVGCGFARRRERRVTAKQWRAEPRPAVSASAPMGCHAPGAAASLRWGAVHPAPAAQQYPHDGQPPRNIDSIRIGFFRCTFSASRTACGHANWPFFVRTARVRNSNITHTICLRIGHITTGVLIRLKKFTLKGYTQPKAHQKRRTVTQAAPEYAESWPPTLKEITGRPLATLLRILPRT